MKCCHKLYYEEYQLLSLKRYYYASKFEKKCIPKLIYLIWDKTSKFNINIYPYVQNIRISYGSKCNKKTLISNINRFKSLNLAHSDLSAHELTLLSIELCNNKSITSLNLTNNMLNAHNIISLSSSLEKNSTLTILDLHSNYIRNEGVKILCKSLKSIKKLDLWNTKLDTNGLNEIAKVLKINTTLVWLDIGNNGPSYDCIFESLISNVTLEYLSLQHSYMKNIEKLIQVVNDLHFTTLNLTSNHIPTSDILRLNNTLKFPSSIKRIKLNGNHCPIPEQISTVFIR